MEVATTYGWGPAVCEPQQRVEAKDSVKLCLLQRNQALQWPAPLLKPAWRSVLKMIPVEGPGVRSCRGRHLGPWVQVWGGERFGGTSGGAGEAPAAEASRSAHVLLRLLEQGPSVSSLLAADPVECRPSVWRLRVRWGQHQPAERPLQSANLLIAPGPGLQEAGCNPVPFRGWPIRVDGSARSPGLEGSGA